MSVVVEEIIVLDPWLGNDDGRCTVLGNTLIDAIDQPIHILVENGRVADAHQKAFRQRRVQVVRQLAHQASQRERRLYASIQHHQPIDDALGEAAHLAHGIVVLDSPLGHGGCATPRCAVVVNVYKRSIDGICRWPRMHDVDLLAKQPEATSNKHAIRVLLINAAHTLWSNLAG
jgi:hypothetical protein